MPSKKVVSWAKPSTVCVTCAGFYLVPLLIQHDYDMLHVSPIDESRPHRSLPAMLNGSSQERGLIHQCSQHDTSHSAQPQERGQGRTVCTQLYDFLSFTPPAYTRPTPLVSWCTLQARTPPLAWRLLAWKSNSSLPALTSATCCMTIRTGPIRSTLTRSVARATGSNAGSSGCGRLLRPMRRCCGIAPRPVTTCRPRCIRQ